MTGRLLSMAEPPPPTSGPPPGWYPDPERPGAHRWWDGLAWADPVADAGPDMTSPSATSPTQTPPTQTSPPQTPSEELASAEPPERPPAPHLAPASVPPPPPAPGPTGMPPSPYVSPPSTGGPLGDVGSVMSQSFRVAIDRAGHFLPMIVVFILSVGLFTSFALWLGLEDTTLTVDPETAETDLDYGGSSFWLLVAAISIPASSILTGVAKAAMARQTWAAQREMPEPWSDSVRSVLLRAGWVVPVALGRAAIYFGALSVYLVLTLAVPLAVLLFPVLIGGLFAAWVGCSFAVITAALAEPGTKAFATSFRLARVQLGGLIGRLVLLTLVGVAMILVFGLFGAPFAAIAGGDAATQVDLGDDTIRSQDVLGPSVMIFALGSVFSALGLGASHVLTTAGTTLMYRNLGGPVGEDMPGIPPTTADTTWQS